MTYGEELQSYDSFSAYRKVRDRVAFGMFLGGSILAAVGGAEHLALLTDIGTISEVAGPAVALVGRLVAPTPPQERSDHYGMG